MEIQLIVVPYDSGHEGRRMGRGPLRLMEVGIDARLRDRGHDVQVATLRSASEFRTEATTAFELSRSIAECVAAAVRSGRFPLVLSGNCNSAIGTLGGLAPPDVGVIWFDAHGDLNTPETTRSGFFDGMALSIVGGHCWRQLAASVSGFRPVPDENVVLVGARDLDAAEMDIIESSKLSHVAVESVRERGVEGAFAPTFDALRSRVDSVYLHVDLDVLDPEEAPANQYAAASGLSLEELEAIVRMVRSRFTVRAAALAAFDPAFDRDDRATDTACHVIEAMAGRC
jgi:arginase